MACIRNSSLIIPLEICELICMDPCLSQRDRHALSLVSRAFASQADRSLYVNVSLAGERKIRTFCKNIARQPNLGRRMRSLVINLPPQTKMQVDEVTRIDTMLGHCVNLKHLTISNDEDPLKQNKAGEETMDWLLDHPFKLTSFNSSYFKGSVLKRILERQPTIEELHVTAGEDSYVDPEPWDLDLPNLKKLSCGFNQLTRLLNMPNAHNIKLEQVEITLLDTTEAIETEAFFLLQQHSEDLRSLSITRYQGQHGYNNRMFLRQISLKLPELKFLRFLDYTPTEQTRTPPISPEACPFTSLETLILLPAQTWPFRDPRMRKKGHRILYYRPESPYEWNERALEDEANKVLLHLPTVSRVVFITSKDFFEYTPYEIPEASLPAKDPLEWPYMDHDHNTYRWWWKSDWADLTDV